MEPIRVSLGKDVQAKEQFWDILPVQTQGMRKQIKKQAQAAMTESIRSGSRMATNAEIFDMIELDDQIIAQTLICMSAGWSWPEPINVKTIEERESWMVDAVLRRMNEIYTRTPEQIKALEKNLLSPS